ncbi:MAG: peptidoglycan DD-metalloendopeptidase family protein [bacterium]|nr:peptidoglycan DD-metalloendopeptidase family protein [bacterium]
MNRSCRAILLLAAGLLVHTPGTGAETPGELETLISTGSDAPAQEPSSSTADLASLRDALLADESERRRLADTLESTRKDLDDIDRRIETGLAGIEPHREAWGTRVSVLLRMSGIPRGVIIAMPAPLPVVHRSSIVARMLVTGIEMHMKDMTRRLDELSALASIREGMDATRLDTLGQLRAIEADIDSASERVREILAPLTVERKPAIETPVTLTSFLHRLAAESMAQASIGNILTADIRTALMVTDIESRKGALPYPAHGVSDGRHRLRIVTAPEEPVITPFDGVVLHSGPFNGSGPLLVIDHGDNYQTILLGFDQGTVGAGEWLVAGQPVAVMAADDTEERTLYVEIRHKGIPVDIPDWLTAAFSEESDQ